MADVTLGIEALGGCPQCGAPLAAASGLGAIGKPFEPCTGCGTLVARRGANEWDLLKPGEKLGHVARHATRTAAIGLASALAFVAGSLGAGRTAEPRDALLWLAGGLVIAGAWEVARLAARIRRSRRRMGDPMYLAKLAEYQIAAVGRR